MPAAHFDIVIEEDADLRYNFTYKDSLGNPIDLTNYGATLVLSKNKPKIGEVPGDPLIQVDNTDGSISIGGANGLVNLNVDQSNFDDLSVKRGFWQLYIYPTSGDITDRPKRLIEGTFTYSRSIL